MRSLAISVLSAVLVACGASTDVTTTTQATITTRPQTTETSSGPSTSSTGAPVATAPATTLPAGQFEISVAGESVEGGGRMEVALGDLLTIRVRSDVADEVHLHGYDLHADVGPDVVGEISFDANVPGIFEIELENAGLVLGELVVR